MPALVIDGCALDVALLDGPADRAPVVFLHEGLGAQSTWRDFPARLCEACGRAGVVYSRAGYGHSDPVALPRPLDYMQREAQHSLPRLLEALNLPRAVLFGHSDGASIALAYAGTPHGQARTEAVIAEAPHVFCEDVSVSAIRQTKQAFLHEGLRERLERHHPRVDVAFSGWCEAWLAPGFRDWNIEAYLPGIEAPCLLVQCEDDPYGTLAQLDAIERGVSGPCARRLFDTGGHAPHRPHAEAVIAAVRAHLEG